MKGRRTAALLCVLLGHALVALYLFRLELGPVAGRRVAEFVSEPITFFPEPEEDEPAAAPQAPAAVPRTPRSASRTAPASSAGESGAVTAPASTDRVDWPIEGQKSVSRILAREAEAERIARMFAGPNGTWASLTKRQRSKLSKLRWKPGVDGLEYDEKGNAIYHLPNGCNIINMMFFGCPIGKQAVHGDMFDNMREYFDEQRLPATDDGNGTEPEALRPAN
jgi:hypothetical protein